MPQQNAYAERVQGFFKYEYFFEYLLTEGNITRQAVKIMRLYNDERPHLNLNKKTPKVFDKMVVKMSEVDRPIMKVYKWDAEKCIGQTGDDWVF